MSATAAIAAQPVALLAPVSGGEPLSEYLRRVIVEDPQFVEWEGRSRALRYIQGGLFPYGRSAFPVRVWPHFAPAGFGSGEVSRGHDGLDLVPLHDLLDETMRLLDWTWKTGSPLVKSLYVRAALALRDSAAKGYPATIVRETPGQPDSEQWNRKRATRLLTPIDQQGSPPPGPPVVPDAITEVLALCRRAARRRDMLIAMFCEDLRSKRTIATGFLADDVKRLKIQVDAEWWSDPLVACFWEDEELRPTEGAPLGTPQFRGLRVYRSADGRMRLTQIVGSAPKRRGPKGVKERETIAAMLAHVRSGKVTVDGLKEMKQKSMAAEYKVSRNTAVKALALACQSLSEFQTRTNDK